MKNQTKQVTLSWYVYLVDRLLTLLVFLGLLLHLFSLLYIVDELEQVPQVQDHRLSLGRQGHIIHTDFKTHTHTFLRTHELEQRLFFCRRVVIDAN